MIKLAITGAGGMAHAHAQHIQQLKNCRIAAACDIEKDRVQAYAERYGIPGVFTDTKAMLAEADIDAVINVTPDAMHLPVSLEAIAAGRHVLCEKPLALNAADARTMAAAAKRKGVINMVNFSYRNSSAVQKAHKLVASGKLGDVVHFEASYLQSWLSSTVWGEWKTNPAWLWRLSTKHGSKGVLGDIGVHIIDLATYVAGDLAQLNCRLKTFTKLKDRKLGAYTLDANDSAVLHCELANGALGVIHTTRWAAGHKNSLRLRVHCTKGAFVVDLDRDYSSLEVCMGPAVHTAEWSIMPCAKTPSIMERFLKSIRTGVNDAPDFVRGTVVQRALDACFESDATGETVLLKG